MKFLNRGNAIFMNRTGVDLSIRGIFHFTFYLSALLIGTCQSSHLLPDKLHSISEVTIYNQDRTINSLTINEFVDPSESKSSLEIRDNIQNVTRVVFNFPSTSRPLYFLTYSLDNNSCSLSKPIELFIDKTRKLAEMVLREHATLDEAFVGPTAVLKSIDITMEQFRYVGIDTGSMIPGYLFQKVISSHPDLEPGKSLIILVQLITSKQVIFTTAGNNLYEMKDNLQYNGLTTCLVPTSSVDDAERRYFCKPSEVTMNINYFLLADLVLGTDLGRLLEPKVDLFNFESDPFTQPIGIGCWVNRSLRGRKKFLARGHQFSAEYETLAGSGGVAFMAYDNEKRIVRIDRKGRKNVYDLKKRISAHHNEIDSVFDLTLLPGQMSEKCIILEMQDDTRFPDNFSIVNLLGVGVNTEQSATHLGSRVIDHIKYEIYERQVKSAEDMPLIMNLDPGSFDSNLMYFITYYVEEYLYVSKIVVPGFDDHSSIPKFMELWCYDPASSSTTLLDVVTFSQFSWLIDAYPNEDAESLNSINLFSMPACFGQDSKRLDLSFLIKTNEITAKSLTGERVEVFKSTRTQLIDQISDHISKQSDVSHLNMMGVKLSFKPKNSTNIFVEARIASLEIGHIPETMVAHLSHSDFVEMFTVDTAHIDTESHHIKECQLDSVIRNEDNYAIYCRLQTTCAIVWKEDMEFGDERILREEPDQATGNYSDDLCFLYEFRWSPTLEDQEKELTPSMLRSHIPNGQQIKLQVMTRDKEKRAQYITYSGDISYTAYRVPSGSISLKNQSQFNGIRYLMKQDSKEGNNYNLLLKIDGSVDDHLRECQVACQLDNYCQSFSLCSSDDKAGECVLSTLSLDSLHIGALKGEPLNPALNPFNETYAVTQDGGCNIHPKETLPSYRFNESLVMPSDDVLFKTCATLSLEECSSTNLKKWLSSTNLEPSNFVYCPMTSCCLYEDTIPSMDNLELANQHCQVYRRVFSEFFEKRRFARMVLEVGANEAPNYMQVYASLEDEQCARLCTGRHSNCVAYDTCLVDGLSSQHPLCILHSIMSPLVTQQSRNVTSIHGQASPPKSMLVGSLSCNHRAMKGLYATSRSQAGDPLKGGQLESSYIYKLEAKLRDEALLRSRDNLKLIRQSSRVGPEGMNSARRGSGFSIVVLMVGMVFGAFGFLYHGTAKDRAMILWTNVRLGVSQLNIRGSDIDMLNLPDNQEEEDTRPFTITK